MSTSQGVVFMLGELMKKHREGRKISQRDVANKLNYKNINFISMIEKGATNIPLNRANDFVKAYELPEFFELVIIKERHADCWTGINRALINNYSRKFTQHLKDVNEEVDTKYNDMLREYGISQ